MTEPDSGYQRLEDQIRWYDTKSASAQWWFKCVKVAEVICAALVPMLASSFPYAAGGLGVAIIVLEALQHLNQWQYNWVAYRSICEALRHEKYSFLGRAGPYAVENDESAKKLLVERVESRISTEHSKWISSRKTEGHRLQRQ